MNAFFFKITPNVIVWQLQNRYFQDHTFYNIFGVACGQIIPSIYDVYDTLVDNPQLYHIFNSHYAGWVPTKENGGVHGTSEHDQYIVWFVLEKSDCKILAKFEGHLHRAEFTDKTFRSGAMFNSEYNIVEFDTETWRFDVQSVNVERNRTYHLGTLLPKKCENEAFSPENRLDYNALMVDDYREKATNGDIIIRLNGVMIENYSISRSEALNDTTENNQRYIIIPVEYFNQASGKLDLYYYKFQFTCKLKAINYQVDGINRIPGILNPVNQNENILNITNSEAILKLIPNSNIQILKIGQNDGIYIKTAQPIMEMLQFEQENNHEHLIKNSNFAFYICH